MILIFFQRKKYTNGCLQLIHRITTTRQEKRYARTRALGSSTVRRSARGKATRMGFFGSMDQVCRPQVLRYVFAVLILDVLSTQSEVAKLFCGIDIRHSAKN